MHELGAGVGEETAAATAASDLEPSYFSSLLMPRAIWCFCQPILAVGLSTSFFESFFPGSYRVDTRGPSRQQKPRSLDRPVPTLPKQTASVST
mmetsp:Transcript_60682/g.124961  ORF Transcript_60682/g.124961 Transcript_60682/m.124961 type:complete len:93 (-) Transcript_60682:53-331(-)